MAKLVLSGDCYNSASETLRMQCYIFKFRVDELILQTYVFNVDDY